jgi:hypothetical protein
MGASYDKLDDHKQSLECKQKSLAIQTKLFGENQAEVAKRYLDNGLSYLKLEDYKKSFKSFREPC